MTIISQFDILFVKHGPILGKCSWHYNDVGFRTKCPQMSKVYRRKSRFLNAYFLFLELTINVILNETKWSESKTPVGESLLNFNPQREIPHPFRDSE